MPGPSDRWLACLPLHHVASLGVLARAYVTGVPCTVHDGFDLDRVGARTARRGRDDRVGRPHRAAPPARRGRADPRVPPGDRRRRAVPAALRARAERAGVRVVDAYGMTETWGGWALDGRPIAGAEARVAAADGELEVRGAMVMRGYRLDPVQTAVVLAPDGWLATGDVGVIDDDGLVRVVDRKKDLVITGGVNVSPTEVEGVLSHHPDIRDVCIVGAPDDEWGERVVAYVVPAELGSPPSLEDLRAFGREQLSAAKLPRELRLVAEIPRSAGGKPLRRVLRDQHTDRADGTDRRHGRGRTLPDGRAQAGERAEEAHRPHRRGRVERRGRLDEPLAQRVDRRASFGRGDEVADRQLVVDELLLRHLDVVGVELVADLLEAGRRRTTRIADLVVARRQRDSARARAGSIRRTPGRRPSHR